MPDNKGAPCPDSSFRNIRLLDLAVIISANTKSHIPFVNDELCIHYLAAAIPKFLLVAITFLKSKPV